MSGQHFDATKIEIKTKSWIIISIALPLAVERSKRIKHVDLTSNISRPKIQIRLDRDASILMTYDITRRFFPLAVF